MLLGVRFTPILLALSLGGGNCQKDDNSAEFDWVQFSSDDDHVEVPITRLETVSPAIVLDLTSSTGTVVIGTATIDPGSAMVGDTLRVTVDIDDDYMKQVDRLDLEIDSGERGVTTLDLLQDSADDSLWVLDLTAYGRDGESRTDDFRFVAYTWKKVQATSN